MKDKCIAATEHGQVLYCSCCGVLHLEFGNLHLPMWIEQMVDLWECLTQIRAHRYERINADNLYRRKVMIPVKGTQITMLFNSAEIVELRELMHQAIDQVVFPESLRSKHKENLFFADGVRTA